jgi:hypothetical protein
MGKTGPIMIKGFGQSLSHRRLAWLLPALIATALTAAACYNSNSGRTEVGPGITFTLPAFPETGDHAVQVFTEMHYQPSYRVQEVPRILPPEDSVPITGKEIAYTSFSEFAALTAPPELAATYDSSEAQTLFQTNCQVCHGSTLKGDGPIRPFMTRGPFPADLTLETTQNSSDGDLFGFITCGGRQGCGAVLRDRPSSSPMPEFGLLLNEAERWALVQYIRNPQ